MPQGFPLNGRICRIVPLTMCLSSPSAQFFGRPFEADVLHVLGPLVDVPAKGVNEQFLYERLLITNPLDGVFNLSWVGHCSFLYVCGTLRVPKPSGTRSVPHTLLHSHVQVLAGTEAGFLGIVGDITPQVIELLGSSNEVIEALLVPEASLLPECAVDLRRREFFPGKTLLFYVRLAKQTHEQMDMRWHDHEIAQLVPLAVKVPQAVGDDRGQLGPFQDACAVAPIEIR